MSVTWKKGVPVVLLVGLVAVLVVAVLWQPAWGQPKANSASSPRYSVIDTEGHNLIVTDNHTNTVYFYTIDKDKAIGSELKLRGSLDLSQVGKATMKLTKPKE